MMGRIWVIAQHEYLRNVRRAGFIALTLALPLIGLLGLSVTALSSGQMGSAMIDFAGIDEAGVSNYGVVDGTDGYFSPILPDFAETFHAYADEEAGRQALRSGTIEALLVIPPTYLEDGEVQLIANTSGIEPPNVDRTELRRFLVHHLTQDQLDVALRARVADPLDLEWTTLEADLSDTDSVTRTLLGFLIPFGTGILLAITIFTSTGYLLQTVAEEKTSRIIEIIISSVSARQLLAGKVLGLGALGLTQVIVWFGSGIGLTSAAVVWLGLFESSVLAESLRVDIFAISMVYYVLGFLLYAVTVAAMGALGASQQEAQQLAGIFTFVAVLPMMMGGFLAASPNALIARVLSYFPYTAPTMMLLRIPLSTLESDQLPVFDIIGSLLVLAVAIPIVLWAGAKIFRMGLLLYGQRPSIGMILRTLRES